MPSAQPPIAGPFTRETARATGISAHALGTSRYRKLFHGCYVDAAAELTHELYVAGALTVVPSAEFVAGRSAARLLGGVVPHADHVELGSTRACTSRKDGIRIRRYLGRPPLTTARGQSVTSAERTYLDLARDLGLVDLVVLGDSLVGARRTTPEQLRESAGLARGAGAVRARAAAALVRQGVDSPQETRVRLLMVLAGLPEPRVDIRLTDELGRVRRRCDMGYEDVQLAIEYDGRHHIRREEQWEADLSRREELEGDGWRLIVVVSRDLYRPRQLLDRLTGAMRAAGMTVPRLSSDWVRHFRAYSS